MIISKGSNTHTRGESVSYELDIPSLLAVPKVSSDSYYSDDNNWNVVTLNYVSAGNQVFNLVFDVKNNQLEVIRFLDEYAIGALFLKGITISSEGKRDLLILRNAIPDVEELDIYMDVLPTPFSDISNVDGDEITLVAESEDFKVGYAVRLYDSATETYSDTFIITDINGLVITLDGSPVGSFDQITFAPVEEQTLEQVLKYNEQAALPFGAAESPLIWTNISPNLTAFGSEGGMEKLTGGGSWNDSAYIASGISGDFILEYKFQRVNIFTGGNFVVGYSPIALVNGNGINGDNTLPMRLLRTAGSTLNNNLNNFINPFSTTHDVNSTNIVTFTITRVGSLITYNVTGQTGALASGTIETANPNTLYPCVGFYEANNIRLISAKLL